MQFKPFDKIPRLFRDVVITEKLDGTNASVFIELRSAMDPEVIEKGSIPFMCLDDYILVAGSRNKWIDQKSDNYGFGKWVSENRERLINLGPGHHFGEWWGQGIQRNYGMTEKRFSLFNTHRWATYNEGMLEATKFTEATACHVVPVLNEGPFAIQADQDIWDLAHLADSISWLRTNGSKAAPGFMKPEGVILYHKAADALFKVLLENDDTPKSRVPQNSAEIRPEGNSDQVA